jgi:tetratricopeptide (TPR) repeat protein
LGGLATAAEAVAPTPAPAVPGPEALRAPETTRVPAPVAEREQAAETELNTATLAELYLSQGVMDKAIAVYRQLLERDPGNERARTRLSEVEALDRSIRAEEALAAGHGTADGGAARREAIERTIAKLERLLSALRKG